MTIPFEVARALDTFHTVRFRAFDHSSNAKTGDIAQVYTSRNTCAVDCPFKDGNGCFGMGYFTRRLWDQCRADNSKALDCVGLIEWAKSLPDGTMIRHNVAGDICTEGTNRINRGILASLLAAYEGKQAYTYTHADMRDGNNRYLMGVALKGDFIINVSCETLKEVAYALECGFPAVLTATKAPEKGATVHGFHLVQCPAQTHEGVTCKTCKLCARADRSCVPVFVVHGNGAKKAALAINRKLAAIGVKVA